MCLVCFYSPKTSCMVLYSILLLSTHHLFIQRVFSSAYVCGQHRDSCEQTSQRSLPSWKPFRIWKQWLGLLMSPFFYSCWASRLRSTPPSPAYMGGLWTDACLSPGQLMTVSSPPSASSLQRRVKLWNKKKLDLSWMVGREEHMLTHLLEMGSC